MKPLLCNIFLPIQTRHFLLFKTMPRIDSEVKLDFKDVLFRPKRSTLKSRSEVCFYIISRAQRAIVYQ